MKDNKFLKGALVLLIGGAIVKIFGFVTRIIYTRIVGEYGISLLMLVMPTYSLLITLAQLSLPVSIAKLVAENIKSNRKILGPIVPIMLAVNVILISLIYFTAPYIASNLLYEPQACILIRMMSFVLPFISITSILKGYFYGKQDMVPNTVSNLIEETVKFGVILLILPWLMSKGIIWGVAGLILVNAVTEFASVLVFLAYLPKHTKIKLNDIKPNIDTTKDVFKISTPTTSARLVGNIGYFFEPIILMNILMLVGYSKDFIMAEYGAYNAYVIPTLIVPSFFIAAVSNSLLPEISRFFANKNMSMVKRRFKQAILISIAIGILYNTVVFIFAKDVLNIIYGTTKGLTYLKVLSPFFVLFYLEGPLISTLQALNKATSAMKVTFLGIILKLALIALLSLLNIGIYSLIIAEIINIFFVVSFNYKTIKKII